MGIEEVGIKKVARIEERQVIWGLGAVKGRRYCAFDTSMARALETPHFHQNLEGRGACRLHVTALTRLLGSQW